jgi:predicted small lipoprotein YifL
VIVALAAFTGCGQKGPLILEQLPIDQTQAPLENSIDQIPVETPAATEEASSASEDAPEKAATSD